MKAFLISAVASIVCAAVVGALVVRLPPASPAQSEPQPFPRPQLLRAAAVRCVSALSALALLPALWWFGPGICSTNDAALLRGLAAFVSFAFGFVVLAMFIRCPVCRGLFIVQGVASASPVNPQSVVDPRALTIFRVLARRNVQCVHCDARFRFGLRPTVRLHAK